MTSTELDPAFEAALWEFIADVRAGTAKAGNHPGAFEFARWLVGVWEATWTELHIRVGDMTQVEAEAAVSEFFEAQRLLTGSLASPQADSRR
jgi:hypothetical protein